MEKHQENYLKNLLSQDYLSIMEYFDTSYNLFCNFIKDKKNTSLWIVYILISTVLSVLASFINTGNSIFLASFVNILFSTFFIRKIQNRIVVTKIETDSEEIKTGKLISKIIIYYLIWILGIVIASIFATIISLLLSIISPQLSIVGVFIVILIILLNLLYFNNLYFLRNIGIVDSLKYSFYLCKNNRFRIILPFVIIYILGILIGIPISLLLTISGNLVEFKIILLIITCILKSLIVIFSLIVSSIIFLNVEYMDLKKVKSHTNLDKTLKENNDIEISKNVIDAEITDDEDNE